MSRGELLGGVQRFDTVTADAGHIEELTRSMFGTTVRVEPSDGRVPSLRLAQAAVDEFGVQRVTWNVDGRCHVAPLDQLLWIRLRRGAYALDQGAGPVIYAAGDTFMVDPTRRVNADVAGADLDSFTLERPALQRVAEQIAPRAGKRLDYRRATPVNGRMGRLWKETLDSTSAILHEDDLLGENPLVRAGVLYRLATTACAVFAITPELPGENVIAPKSLRRALAYIDGHLAEPITVGDVAAAAGLSTRGLDAAFRRVLDVTPHQYLTRARLQAVRQDLLSAEANDTVAVIARRWGFAHLGRFSASYRTHYGSFPSRLSATEHLQE